MSEGGWEAAQGAAALKAAGSRQQTPRPGPRQCVPAAPPPARSPQRQGWARRGPGTRPPGRPPTTPGKTGTRGQRCPSAGGAASGRAPAARARTHAVHHISGEQGRRVWESTPLAQERTELPSLRRSSPPQQPQRTSRPAAAPHAGLLLLLPQTHLKRKLVALCLCPVQHHRRRIQLRQDARPVLEGPHLSPAAPAAAAATAACGRCAYPSLKERAKGGEAASSRSAAAALGHPQRVARLNNHLLRTAAQRSAGREGIPWDEGIYHRVLRGPQNQLDWPCVPEATAVSETVPGTAQFIPVRLPAHPPTSRRSMAPQ